MIIDGRAIAREVISRLRATGALTGARLGVLLGSSDPVTDSFVRIKERVAHELQVVIERVEVHGSTEDARRTLEDLESRSDGVIVQLPLPDSIDAAGVIGSLDQRTDVDGIGPSAAVSPPVARAIAEIIARYDVHVRGGRAVVVGTGRLVGTPAAALLRALGASVRVLTESDSLDALKEADIVVTGTGSPGLIHPGHLKRGVALFDAGTSESRGRVVGDADPACADVTSLFTPVPGGIGPIAVAMIFANLHDLLTRAKA